MTTPLPKYRSGDQTLDKQIADLVSASQADVHDDLLFEMIVSTIRLVREHNGRGDLKLVNAALKELRYAMSVFAPYAQTRKLSIFGSARTPPGDPAYKAAVDLGAAIAEQDWMVITGAGPGIMAAGVEGAGSEHSFGVGITLPFEERAAATIAEDPKLINFKYFFTRKLTFMKESHGYALLPGGFGTLDESFELLTLLQTGKTSPAPVVLLDAPGGDYWHSWYNFVTSQLLGDGLIALEDMCFVTLTDSIDDAVSEITSFYRTYHSMRLVGSRLVLRLNEPLAAEKVERLNETFSDIITRGTIQNIEPTAAELRDGDNVSLARIAFEFDRRHWARLRQMIDEINDAVRPAPTAD